MRFLQHAIRLSHTRTHANVNFQLAAVISAGLISKIAQPVFPYRLAHSKYSVLQLISLCILQYIFSKFKNDKLPLRINVPVLFADGHSMDHFLKEDRVFCCI